MQIWAESGKSALPICNYSQILYQFLTFTQKLKRSRPFRDFSRNTKLSFQNTIMSLISMERSSITSELQKFFNFSVDTPTSSAFVQQRDKLLPVAFQHLFYAFSKEFPSGNIMDLIYLL